MDNYRVELKAICTQTVEITAKDEDEAVEKANDGEGKIVTDLEWHEAYKQDNWTATKI